jgi:hypothetical protein
MIEALSLVEVVLLALAIVMVAHFEIIICQFSDVRRALLLVGLDLPVSCSLVSVLWLLRKERPRCGRGGHERNNMRRVMIDINRDPWRIRIWLPDSYSR